jgi:hypothetical protein
MHLTGHVWGSIKVKAQSQGLLMGLNQVSTWLRLAEKTLSRSVDFNKVPIKEGDTKIIDEPL